MPLGITFLYGTLNRGQIWKLHQMSDDAFSKREKREDKIKRAASKRPLKLRLLVGNPARYNTIFYQDV
jgi:hypothetical protein